MNEQAFALLITWTCYGTWLPGDERGYVANTRSTSGGFQPLHNIPGTRVDSDDADSRLLARSLQKGTTVLLTPTQAMVAPEALVAAAAIRDWRIHRGAVMANHVHLVVVKCPDDGPAVRRVFKGVADSSLRKRFPSTGRWWTQGGSNRYLHGESAIVAAARYVENQEFCLAQIDDNVVMRIDG